jgi:hypothetical protein
MLKIGLIGGMSWESSAEYYRLANELIRDRFGGVHSAQCLLYSVDFAEIAAMQAAGRWEDAAAGSWSLTPVAPATPRLRTPMASSPETAPHPPNWRSVAARKSVRTEVNSSTSSPPASRPTTASS